MNKLYNQDCMEALKLMEDNQFDLAIVDPPYGIKNMTAGGRGTDGWTKWEDKKWDSAIPDKDYFDELRRVSKNTIIWGGNYFANLLPNSKCWLMWDKGQRNFSLADGELAWTSFDKSVRVFDFSRGAANSEGKIHPTQKPVELYQWILQNYAKPGDTILDTHLGSGSIALACHNLGFDLTGYEIDKEYFEAANKRLENHQKQSKLF
jgi:site-specific DNA-methyltransferase (adenine-specific)